MSGGVFISYRREETAGFARLIYDRLTNKLGHEGVFFDVDNIEPGLDFFEVLNQHVGECDALVAVIGRDWISSVGPNNQRRLDDPNDFVRIEIEAALKRGIRVIPVLLDGASMPKSDDLPDSLKMLVRRQGIEISHTRFDSDVERLTKTLSSLGAGKAAAPRQDAGDTSRRPEAEAAQQPNDASAQEAKDADSVPSPERSDPR